MDNVIPIKPKTIIGNAELTEGELAALQAIQTIVADAILEMVEQYYVEEFIDVGAIRDYAEKVRNGE
jgi:hypothetical protein